MSVALVVLAKAPLPGLAKTRLARTVGDEAAATLARHLLKHTLATAQRSGLAATLCGAPSGHPLLIELAEQAGVRLTAQVDGDLGQRLAAAIEQALSAHDAVLVIGSDCPGLTVQHLQLAARQLEQHDAVFYPALDGGYTLIGVRQNSAELFKGMPWSTCEVMSETLRRTAALGWRVWLGEALADIDSAEDLVHLPSHWPRPTPLPEFVT
ncbi:MAG: TIGR04282 family arsenosugar biosynthesis glycosyltransferase [Pseudomonadota bacterium]